jgi:hypothetical protein
MLLSNTAAQHGSPHIAILYPKLVAVEKPPLNPAPALRALPFSSRRAYAGPDPCLRIFRLEFLLGMQLPHALHLGVAQANSRFSQYRSSLAICRAHSFTAPTENPRPP